MGTKHVFVAVLATAALFGLAISGCNRESGSRMADSGAGARRAKQAGDQQRARRELETNSVVRPAEVLSGVAYRTPPRRGGGMRFDPLPPAPQRLDPAQERQLAAYEPLPEPVPAQPYPPYPAYAAYPPAGGYASAYPQPQYYPASAPSVYVSEPYTLQPSPTNPSQYEKVFVHASPQLAVARAQLQGSASLGVPLPTPESFPVPLPELEPIRYTRAHDFRQNNAVAALPPAGQEYASRQPQPQPRPLLPPQPNAGRAPQYTPYAPPQPQYAAPAPARPQQQPLQDWVASPATAMRNTGN